VKRFKRSLLKIVSGFLYGIGFMLAIAVGGYLMISQMESGFSDDEYELGEGFTAIDFVPYDESANLEAVVDREEISDSEFNLFGQIHNNGETDWNGVTLKAILFDDSGEFLDECHHYHQGRLRSGESNYFKVSCGSQCSSIALTNFSRYELEIIDANSF